MKLIFLPIVGIAVVFLSPLPNEIGAIDNLFSCPTSSK